MRNFKFKEIGRLDYYKGYAVYLPYWLSDCVEVYKLYGNSVKSKMFKGKRVITGDHEVEHHKVSLHLAPLSPDARECQGHPASWEHYECFTPGLGETKSLWVCCPGLTAFEECRYAVSKGITSYSYKPLHERVYFYALSPFCYVYHRYWYTATTYDKMSFDREGTLYHTARIFYLKYRSPRYPNAWTHQSTFDVPLDSTQKLSAIDWSYVDNHRRAFDKEALQKYGKSYTPDWSVDFIHGGNDTYVSIDLETTGVNFDPSSQLFTREIPALTSEHLGDLCQRAVDNIHYTDINTMAYLKDLKDFASELQSIARLVKNPLNPKSWASLFLNFQYGSRLTISDTFKLINGVIRCARDVRRLRKKSWRSSRARMRSVVTHPILGCVGTRLTNYKVYYKPYDSGIMSYVHKLANWDLLPTSANLWDFIPFSFVVDWFVDIGGLLESIDSAAMASSLDVVGVLYSTKDTYVISADLPGQQAFSSEYTVYRRCWSRTLHPPAPRLEASDGFLHNIPQLLAILIQRK